MICALTGALLCEQTLAHTRWDPSGLTPGRSNRDDIKSGPCGESRGNNPTVLEAGSTVELSFESTIYHQGYFRIAFSPANDQGFDNYILAENIQDVQGQRYRTATVTLPDMECDDCTLQLIQSMLDRPTPSNYFHCADIQLVRSQSTDTQAPGPVTGLLAVPGDESIHLSWTNPSDADHWQTLVMIYLTEIGATPENGQSYEVGENISRAWVAHIGSENNAVLTGLNHNEYHIYVFTFDRALNYSQAVYTSQALDLVPNIPPNVTLSANQRDNFSWSLTNSGLIDLDANISDENPSDVHTVQWTVEIPGAEDSFTDSDLKFRFDPTNVAPGEYRVHVEVTDSGEPPRTTSVEKTLTITEANTSSGGGHLSWWLLALVCLSLLQVNRSKHLQ